MGKAGDSIGLRLQMVGVGGRRGVLLAKASVHVRTGMHVCESTYVSVCLLYMVSVMLYFA